MQRGANAASATNAANDGPPLTQSGLEPKIVPMEWYRGLKSKCTLQLKHVENFVAEFNETGSVVQSQEERNNLYAPLKKAEEALLKWEVYLEQHGAHQSWMQTRQQGYVDEEVAKQLESYQRMEEKYTGWVIKLNRLCSTFNAAQQEARRRQRSANNEQGANAAPEQQAVADIFRKFIREDEATKIQDGFRPDKLCDSATMLQFNNWKRDINSFFTINSMDKKPRDVQISALYACLDDKLKRFLDVHFASLPNADIVSTNENSYLQVLTNHFENKHPRPARMFNFFNERQRPNESPSEFAQRCESLAITAKIQEMMYDEWLQYKIICGLVHSEQLRSKLLKKMTEPGFNLQKLKKFIIEEQATERVTSAIDRHLQISHVNQLSSYKRQVSTNKADNYQRQQRAQAPMPRVPFQARQRPSMTRPPLPRATSKPCHQCGFTPFFRCTQHYQPRLQQPQPFQFKAKPFQRRVQVVREAEGNEPDDDDADYVNTINMISVRANPRPLDPDAIPTTAGPEYDRNEYGNPIMPNPRQTPLLYAFIRADRRIIHNPFSNPRQYRQVNTPITEVLCLADSGCVQSVCHPNMARACGLEIDRSDITTMYAANGSRLNCIGSVAVQVSYFGIYTDLKLYIMNDVSPNYVILDRKVCQVLNIFHPNFPMPLQMCSLDGLFNPPYYELEPFRGNLQTNPHKGIQAYPPDHQDTLEDVDSDVSAVITALPLMSIQDKKHESAAPAAEESRTEPSNNSEAKVTVTSSFNVKSDEDEALVKINKMIERYINVFDISIKKEIICHPVNLRFRKDIPVVPYKCTSSRPIPFALREAARKEVNEQIKLGIIDWVPPDVHLDWCSRGMVLAKDNARDCRIVIDNVELNKFLDRDAYPLQSPKELVKQIPPSSKVFLSCDFYKGFFQIPLAVEDQHKTAFMLHSIGILYYKRVMQGGRTSVDEFNRITDELVREVPNALKMVDDILFHGPTVEDVLAQFECLLKKCHERNFTLHPRKVKFGNKLLFAGYMVSDKGLEIDPKKVEAIRKFAKPENVTDMKSFLGLAAQFQEACPDLMGTLKPLSDTTSFKITPGFNEKGQKIKNHKRQIMWNKPLEESFIKAKKLLTDANGRVLAPFDPSLPLIIYTDASRLQGLGWIAIQEKEGIKHLVECGSATIPDVVKRNFSVSELELSAVETSLRKMRLLTVGNPKVVVKTDHLPLIGILKKPLDKIETRRLMKLAEKLQSYVFQIEYVKGSRNEVADALSRYPIKQDAELDDTANVINLIDLSDGGEEGMTVKTLDKMACQDNNYVMIRNAILHNVRVQDLPPDHPGRLYASNWHLLATNNNLITLGQRILVPKAARKHILKMLHFAHLGQTKTIALANQLYFWKGMSVEIKQLVDACEQCQTHANFQPKETLKPTFASYPMEQNSADFAEYSGKKYLIHVDRFSGYMWIYSMPKTTSQETKKAMWQTFFQFGFPKILRTDNGGQFTSDVFIDACKKDNIEQEWSSPFHSISNGFCEKYVGIAKNLIKKAANFEEIQRMLQLYNNTPTGSSRSPAQLFFSRKLRTNLPILDENFNPLSREEINEAIAKKTELYHKRQIEYNKSAKDLPPLKKNQNVRIYNSLTSRWDTKGKVIYCDKNCGRSYRIETQNGNLLWRNRRYLRPVKFRRQPTFNRQAWEA